MAQFVVGLVMGMFVTSALNFSTGQIVNVYCNGLFHLNKSLFPLQEKKGPKVDQVCFIPTVARPFSTKTVQSDQSNALHPIVALKISSTFILLN